MYLSAIKSRLGLAALAVLALGVIIAFTMARGASGADHRDAPGVESDAPADITDLYAFRSPANNDNLVIALGVNGLTAPADNATTRFSDDVTYTIHVDVDGDLLDDATVEVAFSGDPQQFTITGTADGHLVGDDTRSGIG